MTSPGLPDLQRATIGDLAPLIARRELSPVDLTERCLERIAARNPSLNAFITVTADTAREQARRAAGEIAAGRHRGPLHGIPVSLKDLVDQAGIPTTAASRVREGHVAATSAPIVSHLERAGAVLVGKCNLHEFAFGTTSDDSAFGPVRNPHDPSRSPGGSSGGSAAAVQDGMCLGSIGTDTGGSIRIPAALCGVVGLKPTRGEVSCEGVVPLGRTLDHVGPLARSVGDAWLLLCALRGDEHIDPLPEAPDASLAGLRAGILHDYFMEPLDPAVRAAFEAAVGRLRERGLRTDTVTIPHARDTADVYLHLVLAEAAAIHAITLDRCPERYTPNVRIRLEMGRYLLAEDYVRAAAGRDVLRREVDAALAEHAMLLLPTVPIPAPPIGAATVEVDGREEPVRNVTLKLTQLFDLTDHPAISVPGDPTPEGLPVGVQIVGRRHATNELVRLAARLAPSLRALAVH